MIRSAFRLVVAILGITFATQAVASGVPALPKDFCKKIMDDSVTNKNESFRADPLDVRRCMILGWDPPKNWKPNEGKSKGVRVSGSGGFSYGSVSAPEAPQSYTQRGVKASVSKAKMKALCSFPPRVKVNVNSGVTIPKGSCLDFFTDLIKDKGDNVNGGTLPEGVLESDPCPVESDPTAQYGAKNTIAAGGSTVRNCGGMAPLTTYDLVLNANPTHLATTPNNGSYQITTYAKNGSDYSLVNTTALPSYLCRKVSSGDSGDYWEKSYDLTGPLPQMITYNAGVGYITLRLKSRETMNTNNIPPYNPNDPETYLKIPIDASGALETVPTCSDEALYLVTSVGREDILIVSGTASGCEDVPSTKPTMVNEPTLNCPPNAVANGATDVPLALGCKDSDGVSFPGTIIDKWKAKCPGAGAPGSSHVDANCTNPTDLSTCTCPQANATSCPAPVTINIPNPDPGGTDYSATCNGAPACSGAAGSADAGCEVMSIFPRGTFAGEVCDGKTQYAVLNRPNLYYPPGTTSVFNRLIGGPGALMANTVTGSQFYTQAQTSFFLQQTAPALIFNEGGLIKLANGKTVIMNPPAIVTPASASVTLTRGGQLVTSGGTQIQEFLDGTTYALEGGAANFPIEVKVSRSVQFPSGFAIPTSPDAPHIRLPIPKIPD